LLVSTVRRKCIEFSHVYRNLIPPLRIQHGTQGAIHQPKSRHIRHFVSPVFASIEKGFWKCFRHQSLQQTLFQCWRCFCVNGTYESGKVNIYAVIMEFVHPNLLRTSRVLIASGFYMLLRGLTVALGLLTSCPC
jgi:hypothetical protein